ncbi:MAG: hypothetical protein LBR22_06770 [Desulfovibrio sp.]|jgi:hypothetical protein|nr:hypothetical protein [Desulfovibrio sp.]
MNADRKDGTEAAGSPTALDQERKDAMESGSTPQTAESEDTAMDSPTNHRPQAIENSQTATDDHIGIESEKDANVHHATTDSGSNDIKMDIAIVKVGLKNVEKRLDDVDKNLGKRIDDVKDSVKDVNVSLGKRIDDVKDSVKDVNVNLGKRIDDLKDSVRGVKEDVRDVNRNLGNRIDDLKDDIKTLKSKQRNYWSLLVGIIVLGFTVLGAINYFADDARKAIAKKQDLDMEITRRDIQRIENRLDRIENLLMDRLPLANPKSDSGKQVQEQPQKPAPGAMSAPPLESTATPVPDAAPAPPKAAAP